MSDDSWFQPGARFTVRGEAKRADGSTIVREFVGWKSQRGRMTLARLRGDGEGKYAEMEIDPMRLVPYDAPIKPEPMAVDLMPTAGASGITISDGQGAWAGAGDRGE
jgi:hypothetical protein